MDQAIYESNIFEHGGQRWNFSFGHNNADGYGTTRTKEFALVNTI